MSLKKLQVAIFRWSLGGANLPCTIHCSVGSDNRKGGKIATRLEGCPMALSAANLADKLSILPQALAILSICYSVGLRVKKPTLLCWNPNWSFANRVNVRACRPPSLYPAPAQGRLAIRPCHRGQAIQSLHRRDRENSRRPVHPLWRGSGSASLMCQSHRHPI